MLFCIFFHFNLACAKPGEKIGVLYSYQNTDYYVKNDIVGFGQVWKSFLETFESTYLNYQFLCNISQDTKIEDLGVNVILFPLALDIDENEQNLLNTFLNNGGKLIITAGIGPASDKLKNFLSQYGINLEENVITKTNLDLKHRDSSIIFNLPIGNFYSVFDADVSTKKIAALWKENNKNAIGASKNVVYIGYSWGGDISKDDDIHILLGTIDYFWKGLSENLSREISKEEYRKIVKEIYTLKEEANSVIKTVEQLDLQVPRYQLKRHFSDGEDYFNDFNTNYLLGNYMKARENANIAKREFAVVYSLGTPVRKVEVRAIWLDRGTIVRCNSPRELRSLIKDLARIGFNVIFFETVNAGYPIYPSKLLPQNPLISNWDPLSVAIEAAHSSGVELHAWVWTFAVGNTKHNLLIGKEPQYLGPIIETKGRSWALASQNGKTRIEMQPEIWISPANKKACNFLIELFSEIVQNYNVDGIQLDYIRFPFQKNHSQMGFDFITKNAYKQATNKLPKLEGEENLYFREWKAKLINDFVKEVSFKLRLIRPNLKISTAVFAFGHATRMLLIQQDWEEWVKNNWIDAVYPFYYSYTKEEIKTKLQNTKEIIGDQALIIPIFNLRVLNIGEFAERVTTARNSGVLGFGLFAAEHLDKTKQELLKKGAFREKAVLLPYNDPFLASKILLNDFHSIVEKFTLVRRREILADSETEKQVYNLTQELKNELQNYSQIKIVDIENKLSSLEKKVKEWLSLEKYLNRDQRTFYITSYLDQIKTLIGYTKGKTITVSNGSPSN